MTGNPNGAAHATAASSELSESPTSVLIIALKTVAQVFSKTPWCASFIFILLVLSSSPSLSKSYCTIEVERALEAQRLLLEGMRIINIPAMQGLASGYLSPTYLVCSVEDINAIDIDRYTISRRYTGHGDVNFLFSATHKTGCSLHFSINPPNSRLQNIAIHCPK
jgi:hypothetical protein